MTTTLAVNATISSMPIEQVDPEMMVENKRKDTVSTERADALARAKLAFHVDLRNGKMADCFDVGIVQEKADKAKLFECLDFLKKLLEAANSVVPVGRATRNE